MTLPPLMITAPTLTGGDVWDTAGLMRVTVKTTEIFDVTTCEPAVSTSCPVFCVQLPVVPNRLRVDVTEREDVDVVCEPVSPVIVTVDPLPRL
jgi:hypothetical protein